MHVTVGGVAFNWDGHGTVHSKEVQSMARQLGHICFPDDLKPLFQTTNAELINGTNECTGRPYDDPCWLTLLRTPYTKGAEPSVANLVDYSCIGLDDQVRL